MTDEQPVEELEIDLLLEGVFRRFGHDFRGCRRERLVPQLHSLMRELGAGTVSALQEKVMHEASAADALLRHLSMHGSGAFFDDPAYFSALRAAVVPWLRSCPAPRIWVAESASPEEVCALAILLEEEDLYDDTQIFATVANEELLRTAKQGGFAAERLHEYARNYRNSGGQRELLDYCTALDGGMAFSPQLLANITWAQYSLATDASFNEFQLIVCRQALAEFDLPLRRRALQLFYDSMPMFGLLGIGSEVWLDATPFASRYQPVAKEQGVYRRVV